MKLIMALSYSSRWEMGEAARQIAIDRESRQTESESDIDQEYFQKYLCTRNFPTLN